MFIIFFFSIELLSETTVVQALVSRFFSIYLLLFLIHKNAHKDGTYNNMAMMKTLN